MIEQLIYCIERPSMDEVRRLARYGFQEEDSIEWPLRLTAPPGNRPIYGLGKCNVVLCYAPVKAAYADFTPPIDGTQSTFYLFTDGKDSLEDCLFLGTVGGHLAAKYNGIIYDHLAMRISPAFNEERPKPGGVPIPEDVWEGLEYVRRSGLTNMLDRVTVSKIAEEFGFSETKNWIGSHKKEYAEGIFKGFEPIHEKKTDEK